MKTNVSNYTLQKYTCSRTEKSVICREYRKLIKYVKVKKCPEIGSVRGLDMMAKSKYRKKEERITMNKENIETYILKMKKTGKQKCTHSWIALRYIKNLKSIYQEKYAVHNIELKKRKVNGKYIHE